MLDLTAKYDRTCVGEVRCGLPLSQTFFQGFKQISPLSLENVELTLPWANVKPKTPISRRTLM